MGVVGKVEREYGSVIIAKLSGKQYAGSDAGNPLSALIFNPWKVENFPKVKHPLICAQGSTIGFVPAPTALNSSSTPRRIIDSFSLGMKISFPS